MQKFFALLILSLALLFLSSCTITTKGRSERWIEIGNRITWGVTANDSQETAESSEQYDADSLFGWLRVFFTPKADETDQLGTQPGPPQ